MNAASSTDLPNDIDTLKQLFLEREQVFLEEKDQQAQRIELLEEYIRYLKQQRFGRSSERHTGQAELFDEAESLADPTAPEEAEATTPSSETDAETEAKQPAKKRGRRKLPEHLPRVKVYHELDAAETQCDCGCQMTTFDEVISEQLGVIPARLYVLQHCRKKYRCQTCESGVKTAPLPPQPIPKSNATPELLAHIIVAKFLDGLPFYRQEKIWQRGDIHLPRATQANWTIQSGTLIQPLINLLLEHQRAGPVMHLDETTAQVLKEPDRPPDGQKYMWVAVGGLPDRPVYSFYYHPSRGTAVAQLLLDDYQGTVMTDDWHVYGRACEALSLTHIACNDHSRRKFKDAVVAKPKGKKAPPSRADMALTFYKKLYAIERRIDSLSAEEKYAIRQKDSVPVWDAFRKWLDKTLPHVNPASKLGVALNYLNKLWDKLTYYCNDGELPISNQKAENAIRPFAIARKNFLFFDSPQGATASANHYSLIMTAKANGLDPFYYLAYVFKELPKAQTVEAIEALLPWNVDDVTLMAAFNWGNGGVY